MLILGFIILWIPVGYLFVSVRTFYWRKVLIGKRVAIDYPDFNLTPKRIYLPICLIWPGQSLFWFVDSVLTDSKNVNKKITNAIMPIIPVSFSGEDNDNIDKNRLNQAALNGEEYYLCCPGDEKKSIRESLVFGYGISLFLGWINLLLWILGLIIWMIIFIIRFLYSNSFNLGEVLYPIK